MSKSWFDWRQLRRSGSPARPPAEHPTDERAAAPLRLLPKKRSLLARLQRKVSPFDLRPGAVESWMKPRQAPAPRPERPADDDRGGIGGPHRR